MKAKTKHRPNYLARELDKTLLLGVHFGFIPVETPRQNDKDRSAVGDLEDASSDERFSALDKAAFLRNYLEKGLSVLPHPTGFIYRKGAGYSFDLAGFDGGLAEALLIRTALSILEDSGYKNLILDINCIGDKESVSAYEHELHSYARKIQNTLSNELRTEIKKDIFSLARQTAIDEALAINLPPALASLSSRSREHFKEVLEYLESLGVEFRLAPELVGNRYFSSGTIFAIHEDGGKESLAAGHRYSRLSKRFGFKKEFSIGGATVFGKGEKGKLTSKRKYKELPKPKFYLVQIGREAKMKALPLIELLRKEHIPVYHFLGKDKIQAQLSNAENLRVPYLLIFGQKEALEHSVTVRNISTRAQEIVPIKDLAYYLKHISL